jgi:hypothetical protein
MTPTLLLVMLLGLDPDGGVPDDGAAPDDASADVETPAAPVPLAAPIPAPTGRFEGRVFARGTRTPLVGATITAGAKEVGETDRTGWFSVALPCGPQHVVVQASEFEPLPFERDACSQTSPLVVRLTPLPAGGGYETVVRAPSSQAEVALRGQELLRTPGTLGDPFRAVESLPGVSAVMWPAPVYAVRGANPGNTGFFLDELRVPALFHFALGPSVVHPYFFESLNFHPGGYPARYGRYVSGVVLAKTRPAPVDDVHASVDVRLYDAGAMVSAPLPGNGAVAAAARYSYTGAILSQFGSTIRQLDYWDYQLRADRTVGPVRLTLFAFGSNDVLVPGGSTPTASELRLRFHRVRLRADVPLGGGVLMAAVGVGADHTKAPLAERFPVEIDSVSLLPRLAYVRPTRHAVFEVGFDGELQRFSAISAVRRVATIDLAQARDVTMLAAYASAAVRAGERLLVTPELRLDSYRIASATADTRRADLGPRLSARLAVSPRLSLVAAGGRFTQTPSLPVQLPGAESFGLALLGLQTSWQGSLGATTRLAGLDLGLTGYVQRYVLSDVRDPTVVRSADPLADDYLVRRDALSYGLELLVRRPASERLHGWLAYTLSRNDRAFGGGAIGPSDWDQRHVLNLVAGYRVGRYTLGGRFHYNTGRPVLVGNAEGERFVRLPDFYEIDLRVDRRFLFDAFALDLYLELVNATLNPQVVGLTQEVAGGPLRETSYRIVLPSIGVRAEL